MKHSTFKLFGIALALWGLTVAPAAWSAEPWKVPAEESKKKNPVKADAASIGKGKKIFAERCAICHGEKADGKGASASALNPPRPASSTRSTWPPIRTGTSPTRRPTAEA